MGRRPEGMGLTTPIALFCGVVLLGGVVRWLNLLVNGRLPAAFGADLAERALGGGRPSLSTPAGSLRQPGVAALAPPMRQLIHEIIPPLLQLASGLVLLLGWASAPLLLAWQVVWPEGKLWSWWI